MKGPLEARALDLVDALSNQHKVAWATERAMRRMLTDDGRKPGERSISRVLRRAAKKGTIVRKRIMPGGRLPNGQYSRKGTTINVRRSRQQQRADARRVAKERRAKQRALQRPAPALASPPSPPSSESKGEKQVPLAEWLASSAVDPRAVALLQMAVSPRGLRLKPPTPD
jgi:hypothetical protein